MTINEAKEILLPAPLERGDGTDPLIVEAIALADREPELREWLERQSAIQSTTRQRLREIPVPADLRGRILASSSKIIRPAQWWRHPTLWSAAAMLMLLLGAGLWIGNQSTDENSLATFRGRMVGAVLRQYTMDIVTNDMSRVRSFLASKNSPADYVLPEKLGHLPVTGGGVLSWQGEKVSMVCFDSLNQGTLFLFVVNDSSLGDGPRAAREFQQVNKLGTVSWNANGKTYVLAGSGGEAALEQYF